jgi:hypothetical protein
MDPGAWPVSWEANERVRLRDNLKLSFRQKLQWLEDATVFAQRLQNAPTRTRQEVQAIYAARRSAEDDDASP